MGDEMLSEEGVDRLLAGRMDRQAIFTQSDPPQFVAVIDEMVLGRTGEDVRGLMVEQITHLISCAEQPSVSVHIVPAEVGLHVGLSGPFVLARGADGGWVGHLEKQLGGTVVDTEDDLATLLARWESVRNEALSRRQSIELMKRVVTTWS